jgi:hypothetical protein
MVFIANTYIGGFWIPFRPAPQTIWKFLLEGQCGAGSTPLKFGSKQVLAPRFSRPVLRIPAKFLDYLAHACDNRLRSFVLDIVAAALHHHLASSRG